MTKNQLSVEEESDKKCRNGVGLFLQLLDYENDETELSTWMKRVLIKENKTIHHPQPPAIEGPSSSHNIDADTKNEEKPSSPHVTKPLPYYLVIRRDRISLKPKTVVDTHDHEDEDCLPCKKCGTSSEQEDDDDDDDEDDMEEEEDEKELPEKFQNKIMELGGSKVEFVIEKKLTKTDLSRTHSRLSIPKGQIKTEFVTPQERQMVHDERTPLPVQLIDPRLHKWNLNLVDWDSMSVYGLAKRWNNVHTANNLEAGMIVQVWSFRVQAQLCFALVLTGRRAAET